MKQVMSVKRILYTVCFFWLCLIDQRIKTSTGIDGWDEVFRDSLGIVIAIIVLSHYNPGDLFKRKWVGPGAAFLGVLCGIITYIAGVEKRYYVNSRITITVAISLAAFAAFITIANVFLEKRLPTFSKGFSMLLLAMFVWMIISRSTYIWPLAYLIIFGMLYLTDFTESEENALFYGLLDGLIAAFILFQGFCLVFRPYDCPDCRYVGIHSNSNQNSIFYLEVLAAVFTRIALSYRAKSGRSVKTFWWLACGVVYSFIFLTIGRTAWLLGFIMGVMFLIFMNAFNEDKQSGKSGHFYGIRRFFLNGFAILLSFVITFPITFYFVRYVPALFHHPIWFWGEWNEEKVHSFDPWDSPYYVDLDEFLDAALGRIVGSVTNFKEHSPFAENSETENAETENLSDAETNVKSGSVDAAEGTNVDGGAEDVTANINIESEPVDAAAETIVKNGAVDVVAETIAESVPADAAAETNIESEPVDTDDPRAKAAVLTNEQGGDSLLVRSTIYSHYARELNLFGHPYSEQGFQLTPTYWIGHAHNIYLQYGTDFGIPVMVMLIGLTIWSALIFLKRVLKGKSIEDMTFLFVLMIPFVFGLLEFSWGVGSVSTSLLFIVWRRAAVRKNNCSN